MCPDANHLQAQKPSISPPLKMMHATLDGGYGWVIVLASFLSQACSVGVFSSFGVFLEHYINVKFLGKETSSLALIGIVGPVLICFLSMFTGRLCDVIGFRMCIFLGGVLVSLSHLLASFAIEIWHLVLTQGVLFGMGGSLIFVAANTCVIEWFSKYRGVAVGIGTSGSGIGGVLIAQMNTKLIPRIGLERTFQVNAAVFIIAMMFAAAVIRPRCQIAKESIPAFQIRKVVDFKFGLFGLACFLGGIGFLIPNHFSSAYATWLGYSSQEGGILISGINFGSAVGRVMLGFLGDRLGHENVFLISFFVASASCAMMVTCTQFLPLVLASVLYGGAAGGFISSFVSVCAALFGQDHLSTFLGAACAFIGAGQLIGLISASAAIQTSQDYSLGLYLSAGFYLLATPCILAIKFLYFQPCHLPEKSSPEFE